MKKLLAAALAAMLLLCLFGCKGKEPTESADDGLLTAQELLGTYDIFYQSESGSGTVTADLRILNDRLTFALYPSNVLESENSFESYDPESGIARLQAVKQDENGELAVSCEITFAEAEGSITFSGEYTVTRVDEAQESYTLFGEMTEKI